MLTQGKKEFIEFMIGADVLRFGDFTAKSGRKTPYFVNTGNYRTGKQLLELGRFYAACINEVCGSDFTAMFGPAYKGIPLVSTAAIALADQYGTDKPYFFNRKEAKDHGEGGTTIGYKPQDGDKIIIIEDVITAGTAVRETVPVLRSLADINISDMFISVDRCEVGAGSVKTAVCEVKEEFGINVHSIINVTDIYEYLSGKAEYADVLARMKDYMDKYCVLQ